MAKKMMKREAKENKAKAEGGYRWANNTEEWRQMVADNAPPPDKMYRWSNLKELHNVSRGERSHSLDVSEDPDFYFAPPTVTDLGTSWVDRTYVRVVLDGQQLSAAGWKRYPSLFGEMAWLPKGRDNHRIATAYGQAIRSIEIMNNPAQEDMRDLRAWVQYRFGPEVTVTKNEDYNEWSG